MKKLSSERHGLPVIQDRAAGIDIGSRFHVVAVPADLTDVPIRTFQAFTADLEQMAASLTCSIALSTPSTPGVRAPFDDRVIRAASTNQSGCAIKRSNRSTR